MAGQNGSPSVALLDLTRQELTELLSSWGYSKYYSGMVWSALYRQQSSSIEVMPGLRSDLRNQLSKHTILELLTPVTDVTSDDGLTKKILFRLRDGKTIETVIMGYRDRITLCVSTQVGCAIGCVFCATGQMGFKRNLTPGEIVAQVQEAGRIEDKERLAVRNIVFMGMGEPMHNFESTMTAIEILTDDRGLAIGARHITISTIGLPNEIRKFADIKKPVNLAVSLHAANDEDRSALVPINNRWPLVSLIKACYYYQEKTGRRIFFEWALIAGKNDAAKNAHEVGQLLSNMDAHLNLIPLNPTIGFDGQPAERESVSRFQQILREYGLPSTVRQRKGIDINAGCGQLRVN
jgi:23S rRNA (adenine2503-C2)-methyltransferase